MSDYEQAKLKFCVKIAREIELNEESNWVKKIVGYFKTHFPKLTAKQVAEGPAWTQWKSEFDTAQKREEKFDKLFDNALLGMVGPTQYAELLAESTMPRTPEE